MSNENALAAFGSFDTLAADLAASQQETQEVLDNLPDGGVDFTKFYKCGEDVDKDGNPLPSPWAYGQDNTPIYPDDLWVVDASTIQVGWFGYERDAEGNAIGRPTEIFARAQYGWPKKDPARPWANRAAFKFQAVCIQSANGNAGAVIEHTESRGMAQGFADLASSFRSRLLGASNMAKAGNQAEAIDMLGNSYPRVQLKSKRAVPTKNGRHNKPILEFVSWGPKPIIEQDDPDGAVASPPAAEEPKKPAARRRRAD